MNLKFSHIPISLILFGTMRLIAQPFDAASDSCRGARVLCSPILLNDQSHHTLDYFNPSGCAPLCPNAGLSFNTSWWAFRSPGGKVNLKLSIQECNPVQEGMQVGIWADCNCGESLVCQSECNNSKEIILTTDLNPCKTYYLFINGCNGALCNFSFSVQADFKSPDSYTSRISGPSEICAGGTNQVFEFRSDHPCLRYFEWFIDGVQIADTSSKINLSFKQEGSFILCSSAYSERGADGIPCEKFGPECKIVKVGISQKILKEEIICNETAGRYIPRSNCFWDQNQRLICRGVDASGCFVDTQIQFIVLDIPEAEDVYYLASDPDDYYVDFSTGQRFRGCHYETKISLPKSTYPHQCDSSYHLFMITPKVEMRIRNYRKFNFNFLELRWVDLTNQCGNSGITHTDVSYKWYRASDPAKKILGSSDVLRVFDRDTFCVDLGFRIQFGSVSRKYSFTACAHHAIGPKISTKEDPLPDSSNSGFSNTFPELILQNAYEKTNSQDLEIIIMPNPANCGGNFFILANKTIHHWIITDMNGQIIFDVKPEIAGSRFLQFNNFSKPGIFLIQAEASIETTVKKIIVHP